MPFVAIAGDDERAKGEVAFKDLASGEQQSVRRADAASFIAARLRERKGETLEPLEP